jgi:hypothetical protein
LAGDPDESVAMIARQLRAAITTGDSQLVRRLTGKASKLAEKLEESKASAVALAKLARACAPVNPLLAFDLIRPAVESARNAGSAVSSPPPRDADDEDAIDQAEMTFQLVDELSDVAGFEVAPDSVPWQVEALTGVLAALPATAVSEPEAMILLREAERAARRASNRDAIGLALALVAEATSLGARADAVRLALEAAQMLEYVSTEESAKAATRISAVAARERRPDSALRAAARHALARSLTGSSWLYALAGVGKLAPAQLEAIAKKVADEAARDAQRDLPSRPPRQG